ncbi:MAG: NUDIX hydrolase, partial [Thermoplasmata archaeon]
VDVSQNYERCKGEGVAVVMDSRRWVVLLKRSSTDVPQDSERWVLPSGRIRLSETIEDGTVREVREETGLDVRLARLIRIDWVITEFRTWVNKRLHFTFLARSYGGALKPRDQKEILEAEWFLPDDLLGLIRPPWLRDFLLKEASR